MFSNRAVCVNLNDLSVEQFVNLLPELFDSFVVAKIFDGASLLVWYIPNEANKC